MLVCEDKALILTKVRNYFGSFFDW